MLRTGELRPENPQLEKAMEALEKLRLSPMEQRIARSYLKGECGETALKGLYFYDMTQMSDNVRKEVSAVFEDYRIQQQYAEASRFFELLYALCLSTFEECIDRYWFWELVESGRLSADLSRVLTVMARGMLPCAYVRSGRVVGRRYLQASDLESLGELIHYDLQAVRQAIREYREKAIDVKLILYTLYFYLRSGRVCLNAGRSCWDSTSSLRHRLMSDNEGFIGGIQKKKRADAPPTVIGPAGLDSVDQVLLREYEDVMTRAQRQIFKSGLSRELDTAIFLLIGGCAYANYRISQRLRNVVAACGSAAPMELLQLIHCMREFAGIEDGLDKTFGIPAKYLIQWVVQWVQDGFDYQTAVDMDVADRLLRSQFRGYPSVYLAIYEKADFFISHVMARAVREVDAAVYQRRVLSDSVRRRGMVTDILTTEGNSLWQSREYLEGRLELTVLRALKTGLGGAFRDEYSARRALEWYDEFYHDEQFYARCMAYMALRGCKTFFLYVTYSHLMEEHETSQEEMVRHSFQGLDLAGTELARQVHIACLLVAEAQKNERMRELIPCCAAVFSRYLAQYPQETRDAFAGEGVYGRYLALQVYDREDRREELLAYSLDSSAMVRGELIQILARRTEWREQVMELLHSPKAAQREIGIRVLADWDTPQDRSALWKQQEEEKNARLCSLLDEVLSIVEEREELEEQGAESGDGIRTRGELVRELHSGSRRRVLAWACETPFCTVHRRGGGRAKEEYLQALLLCYSSMEEPGPNGDAVWLAEKLEPRELALYMNELFDKWMEGGAEIKKRWVLYAVSVHGDGNILCKLGHQIRQWARHTRSALAAEAVSALAFSPQPQALVLVDGIARETGSQTVRAAAARALERAALHMGLTREQLEDRITPDLGFDAHMERCFDYGKRCFTVTLTPALEVEIYDGNGKRLKHMPAPGAMDEPEKAAAAYADFKELKKQIKTVTASQKRRLERALSSERLWSVDMWRELFICNPLMHPYAVGLVWGLYEEHRLKQSFRYMEDGSFNTQDEREYTLPSQGQIGLVHPIELSADSLESWRRQLEDYEIVQPIEQLGRTVYRLAAGEWESNRLMRFDGIGVNDLTLGDRLTAMGWQRGPVWKGGRFFAYFREESLMGLAVEMRFSGSSTGNHAGKGQEVTVRDVVFYQIKAVKRGPYVCEEATEGKQISLMNVPRRFFSETVWQLSRVMDVVGKKNENADTK